MLPDIHDTRRLLEAGRTDPITQIEQSISIAQSEPCAHVFLSTMLEDARTVAGAQNIQQTPLAGMAVSIKDLFDIAGQTTQAGSVILKNAPAAAQDSVAVGRLRRAGATLLGRTNMTEFAFSGVGVNPHFGTPANATATDVPRIPGGSSSGAAVSVATGAAFIGLGTDTGGSIRIPAALNGLVGFKNTARTTSSVGALPLSPTLDTVCALTRSVRDSILAHEILSQRPVTRSNAPIGAYRLAVANTLMQDELDPTVSQAWQRSLQILRSAGARIEELTLAELNELGNIQSTGGFTAAESYHWHRHQLTHQKHLYDPRVAPRILRGATLAASEYLELQEARRHWIGKMDLTMQGIDAVLSPTVPIIAPPIADLAPGSERDKEFFRVNALLLRNTSAINLLDGCAISIPCQTAREFPVGLMIWAGAMRDDSILNIALHIEQILQDNLR